MYVRYAHIKGFKTEILYAEYGKASLAIEGQNANQAFENESGKHVVQRCPPTENKGRRHTSMICVAVLPLIAEATYNLQDTDIVIETKRGSGPGGQHKNKTESCVKMRHIPTGITATIDSRDQQANKKEARKLLESRVRLLYKDNEHAEFSDNKRRQMDGGGRGNKIRTYNFIESRVTDHRLGTKTGKIDKVMKGQLELLWKTP